MVPYLSRRTFTSAVLAPVILALACATTSSAPDPLLGADAAYRTLREAVGQRQRATLWRVLDQRTLDTWQAAWRTRRASHELLALLGADDVANDPELRALPPLPPPSAQEFFFTNLDDAGWAERWKDLAADLDPTATLIELGTDAQVLTASGERLAFRKAPDGTWGFSGLAEPARQVAQRELILLERLSRLVATGRPGLLPGSAPWR